MAMPIVTLTQDSSSYLTRMLRDGVLAQLVSLCLGTFAVHAQDATWRNPPGSTDWNTAANWMPAAVPTGTATFGPNLMSDITFGASTSIGTLVFTSVAPSYRFTLTGFSLTITGGGIVDNSDEGPNFTNNTGGTLNFSNTSTADDATIGNFGGTTSFHNSSTAGSAFISTFMGGTTLFDDTSTAGNSQINTNSGGVTSFLGTSTAGSAIFNSTGVTVLFGAGSTGGQALFSISSAGVLDISNLTSDGMTAGSIQGAGVFRLGGKTLTVGSNNFSKVVSGVIVDGGLNGGVGGALIKVGTGTLTLTGADTYTGGTTVNAGTLQIGNGGTTGSIVGNVLDNSNLVFSRSDVVTFSGLISGTGTLSQIGSGTLILNGTNIYTGGTAINAGTLQIGNGGTTGSIVGNVLDNGILAFSHSDAEEFSGLISGSGSLSQIGTGTTTVSGNNSYSGVTAVGAGTLQAGSATAFSPTSAFTVNSVLDLNGFSNTVGSLAGSGTGIVTNTGLTPATLTAGGDNTSTTFSGVLLDGTGLGLTKVGTGTLSLSGVNTYSGGTAVAGGVLRVPDDTSLGAPAGGIILQGGELLTTEGTFSSARLVTLSTAGSANTLAAATGTTANYSGAVGGSGGLQVGDGTNTGIVVLSSGANAYLGGTTILGGASLSVDTDLELGDPSGGITLNVGKLLVTNLFTARTVTLLGAGTNSLAAPDVAARYFPTFAGLITGGGGLTVGDINSLTLFLTLANATNTPNDYTGGTTITGGATLMVDTDGELGNLNGGITLAGGTLQTTTDGFSTARIITLIPGSRPNSILIGFGQTATYTGAIGGTGGLTFQNGTAVLTNSNNSYAGGTTIAHATLIVDTDAELGALSGGITLMGGTLVSTVDGFTSARSIVLNEAEGNDTLAATVGTTATYTGSISGDAPLFVDSVGGIVAPGTVVLTNATNSYTAGTTVEDGATLKVDVDAELGAPIGGLTLSGGELLTTAEFSSARTILLQRGIDILAAATGTTAGYSGVISDNGRGIGLVVGDGANRGTLVLASGANTYSGGTTILNTTLIVDTNGELGAPSGGLTLEGGELLTTANGFASTRTIQLQTGTDILAAATGTTATYRGVISLNGVVLTIGDGLSNNGTVMLASGANTYSGGTLVLGSATLSVNSDAELGNISGGIALRFGGELLTTSNFTSARSVSLDPEPMGAGMVTPLKRGSTNTLAAAANTTATYTGVVFGTGGLAVGEISGNHPGVVVLTNLANSYTGGTIVQGAATLSVADDANLGDPSGGITLATGELLTTASGFDTTRSVDLRATAGRNILSASTGTTATYSGVLSDEGALVINDATHAGTVMLAGNNTYSGGTLIERGTLLVDNPQALGTGDVIVNGGILAADPQPIDVLGNYTQSAAGTLRLSIAGRAAGQFDVLNVTGNAALNGTLQLLNLGYHPQGGDQLRLITTGGVVSSRFSQFINPFLIGPGFNTVDLVYARKSVTLEFLELATPVIPLPPGTPGTPSTPTVVITTDFSSFAFTPNQSAAANLLDAVQLDPRAADLVSFLNTEPFTNLPNDFQKISPEGLTAFYEIGFSNANMQKLTLEGRLDDLHNGSNGFTSNMKVNGATVSGRRGREVPPRGLGTSSPAGA